jgi:hypothetical protein
MRSQTSTLHGMLVCELVHAPPMRRETHALQAAPAGGTAARVPTRRLAQGQGALFAGARPARGPTAHQSQMPRPRLAPHGALADSDAPPSCQRLLRCLISGGLGGVQREALPAAACRRACAACGRGLGSQTQASNQGHAGFCSAEGCGTEGRSEGKGGGCSGDEPTDEGTRNAAQSGIEGAEHSKACPPSQQGGMGCRVWAGAGLS